MRSLSALTWLRSFKPMDEGSPDKTICNPRQPSVGYGHWCNCCLTLRALGEASCVPFFLAMLCLCREPMVLSNFPQDHPHLELARKTARWMDGGDPLQAPVGQSPEDAERNACNLEFRSLRQSHGAKVRLSFVVPPGKKILLLQAM